MRSLRFWLALGLSAVVAMATLVLVAVLLGVLLPLLNDQVESSNRGLAVTLSRQVDDFLRGSAAELQRVGAEIEAVPASFPAGTRVIIDTEANADAALEALYILDASARVVDVGLPLARRSRRDDLLGLDFSARSFLRARHSSDSMVWSDSYLSQRGEIVVAITVPLGGQALSTVSAGSMLVGEIDLHQLSAHIMELGHTAAVLPIIIDRLGQVVAHPDADRAARQENLAYLPLVQAGLAGHFGTDRFWLDGHEHIGTVAPIGNSGWLTLVAQPTDIAFATMRSTLLAIAGGLAAALALAVLSAYLYGQRLVRRIADFGRHVQAIADGDYAAPLPSSRAAELENLALSMRRMANAILEREAALAASEAHYHALFSGAPLAYQSLDVADSRLIEVNDAWLALLGYRREEVVGREIGEFLDSRSLPVLREAFPSFVSNGQIDDLLLDFQHQDGRAIRVQLNGRIHQTPQGGARTNCILTDISERQRRDEARRRSAALLHHQAERALAMLELPKAAEQMEESTFIQHGLAVVEQLTGSPVSFLCFVDADQQSGASIASLCWSRGTQRSAARALSEQLSASRLAALWDEALGQRSPLLFDAEQTGITSAHRLALAGLERLIGVPVVEGGQGRMLLGVANKAESYSESDIETTRLIGQDIWRIVNQRRAEQAQRLAATVFSASTSAICITDADERIVAANPALTTITGYAQGEVIGETPRLFSAARQSDDPALDSWARIAAYGVWQGEVRQRRKNGEIFPAWLTITAVKNADARVTHYTGSFDDISERKQSEAHIHFLAHHDALTRLPNRLLLEDRIRRALAKSRRDGTYTAVLFLDLDRFKLINDTLGHGTGDQLLTRVAARLSRVLRETETVARLGGDEFIIVIPDVADVESVALVAEKVLAVVAEPELIDKRPLHVTPSIGISIYPQDGADVHSLLRSADTAMYHAKERGRNNFQFFTEDMNQAVLERVSIENDLRIAIVRGEFELFYQPQVDSRSGEITGMEALIRWHHPQRGLVAPNRFIPIAEETGLIVPIGEWVLREACRQAKRWHDAGQSGLRISVNLSARQLQQGDLGEQIAAILAASNLQPQTLELELTESLLMDDPLTAVKLLHALTALGVRIAIDDFGTGYSSLAYLKRFPVSRLKIDRSFVRDLSTDANDAAIVQAVVAMAESLKMEVIAEGVETVEQLRFLAAHGCFAVQGFLFSRPLPATEFTSFRFSLPPGG
jgi:diguanylate cyclase (GGDEF)-like protein/PAS domain S-box-containing protein